MSMRLFKIAMLFALLTLPVIANGQTNSIQAQSGTLGPGTTVQAEYTNDPPSPESLAELRRVQDERARRPKPETPVTPVVPGTVVEGPTGSPTEVTGPNNVAPEDFQVYENNVITAAPNGFRSTVGEISVGANSNVLFATGNWYGAISFDHGNNWQWVDPFNTFPASDGGFCCDQEVIYDDARDMMIWLLQYSHDGDDNRYRIAVAVGQDNLAQGLWTYWDILPSTIGMSINRWFDYPHVALSNDHFFITYNSFRTPDGTGGSTSGIMRFSLDQLAAGGSLNFSYWDQSTLFNFTPVQGATTTMYWASHISTSQIRVYRWASTSGNIFSDDVNHGAYTSTTRGDGNCPGPDAKDLCVFFDDRVMGGWVSNGRIGFVWMVAEGGGFPYPYTRYIRLVESTRALIDEPQIWNSNYAWVYPAVSPNSRGHLGGMYTIAGGTIYQWLNAWIADDYNTTPDNPQNPEFIFIASGTDGPQCARWGDYYRSRPHSPYGNTWVATGHTLNGGDGAACGFGSSQVTPRVVWFGRERDRPQDDVTISSLWASLDGPYTGGGNSDTSLNPYVPLSQPYCTSPWFYCGGESRNPMPSSVVDWGLIRLYAGHPDETMTLMAQRAGLIYDDGRVFAATGGVAHFFDNIWGGKYWIAFYHRNHLGVITDTAVNFESGAGGHSFRFHGAFGANALRPSGDGYDLLWGGDASANGSVTSVDFTTYWLPQNGGPAGYSSADFNMSSSVTAFDYLNVWLAANGLASYAPSP